MAEVKDEIRMKIEADGTITVKTQAFSPELHLSADNLIKETFKELGGTRKYVGKNKAESAHTHVHTPQKQTTQS